MSANLSRRLAALRQMLAPLTTPAVIGLLLLLGVSVWVMPVQFERVTTDPASGEVRRVAAWDTSRWQAAAAFWWQGTLLLVALTAVLSVTWTGRRWLLARASAARFFVASLLLHCLLVLWLGAVPLARAVVEHAEVIRIKQAQLFDDPQPALPGSNRAAYEKVAELRPEETARPDVVRVAPAPVQMPDAAEPLVPTIPSHAVRSLPPERLLFVPPRLPESARQPQEIERRNTTEAIKPAEVGLVAIEPPPPEVAPKEKPVEERPITQARQEPTLPAPSGPASLPLPELKPPAPPDLRPQAAAPTPEQKLAPTPDALTGRRPLAQPAPAAPREPAEQPKAEAAPTDKPAPDARVALLRMTPPPQPPAPPPDDLPELHTSLKPPITRDTPPLRPIETPPRPDPLPERLPRTPAVVRVAPVEEKSAPPPLLVQRQKEVRDKAVEQYGGTRASEEAVERGLDWLAAHQSDNGSWSLDNFQVNCKHPRCSGAGTVISDPAGTGLVLLPFLGAGHTHQAGARKQTVARALQWLLDHQEADGTWSAPADNRPMYGHGMASIVLCEAYGMTRDPKLREPAQRAIDYIVKAQNPTTGGWRYTPRQSSDTSVLGWQVMALKSGEMAGLTVPPKVFDGARRWLASVEGNRPVGGQFGYQAPNPTPAMTAQGLLCLQYLGTRRDDPRMRAGTDYLLKNLPRPDGDTSYYWYHATQVMYHVQGKHWKAWNDRLRDMLVSTQERKGSLAGSWESRDEREKPGGRLYATALRLLMLEVYYRHLPLYQQLEK
jgi:hypothetical protein